MEVWRHLSDITELVVDESSALQLLMRFSTRSTTWYTTHTPLPRLTVISSPGLYYICPNLSAHFVLSTQLWVFSRATTNYVIIISCSCLRVRMSSRSSPCWLPPSNHVQFWESVQWRGASWSNFGRSDPVFPIAWIYLLGIWLWGNRIGLFCNFLIDYHEKKHFFFFPYQTNGVFVVEVDESNLSNISGKAPVLTVCCVFSVCKSNIAVS